MTIEQWEIDRVKPYHRNARVIPQKAVDKVAASLKEFGWQQPIVVDADGVIIVGHVRLKAARQNGYKQVPVVVATSLTPAQVKAYRLMDNRSHDETSWDFELLTIEMQDLKAFDLDLALTGFELPEIEGFLAPSSAADEAANEVPEVPVEPVSRLGDLWQCGEHRVLCGDATKDADVHRLLGDAKPFLMVTDPPYGVDYDPEWRKDAGLQDNTRQSGKVMNDDRADWSQAWALFPGDVAYVWHGGAHAALVAGSLAACALVVRSQIIWAKTSLVIGRGAYHWQHEPCWYAVRKGKTAHWHGDRKQSTLWTVANLNGNGNRDEETTGHGTQKPIELMRRPILNHTVRGDLVYDPFLGSGTTLIACDMTERTCFGLDLDPGYVDVIVRRWEKQSGREAVLTGDGAGRAFSQVKIDRAVPVAA